MFSLSLEELTNVVVTTTSKYAEKASETAGNVTVFTREQIQERGYRNIHDILRAMPGVDIQDHAQYTNGPIITFRGNAENNKFLILQDGVRISSAAGESTSISHNFPIYYAKQVEVLLGPAAVSYGADAFMGVVNIITMDQDDDNLLKVEAAGGTDGYGSVFVYLNEGFENGLHLSLGAHAFQSQKYDFADNFPEYYPADEVSPTGKEFLFPRDKAKSFFIKLRTQEHWEFGLNYSWMQRSSHTTSLPSKSAFDLNALQDEIMTTVYTRYNVDISPDIHSTTLFSYIRYERDHDSKFNNTFTGFETQYKYARTDRGSINQDFSWKLTEEHLLSAGLVYDYFDTLPAGADLPSPYDESKDSSDQGMFYPGTTLPLLIIQYTHYNFGGYLQDNWEINENWRLVSGIRFDQDSIYGDTVNPKLVGIYQPDPKNLVKIIYGQSYLAPAPDRAFRNFGGFSGFNSTTGLWESSFFAAPNPDLGPEKLETIEINYEHWFSKNTHIKLAPYYTQVDDVIINSADDSPQQFIPGADLGFTQSYKNSGELEIYGLDLSIDHILYFNIYSLRTWGSFSYVDGTSKDDDVKTDLPLISPYKLKGGVTLNIAGKYIISPQIYWIGSANNNEADPDDSSRRLRAASYFLVDLHTEVRINDNFRIYSDIYNLLDEKYTNAMGAGTSSAVAEAPQPGRLFTLGLSYEY